MLQVADAPASVSGGPFGAVHLCVAPPSFIPSSPPSPTKRPRLGCWDVILPGVLMGLSLRTGVPAKVYLDHPNKVNERFYTHKF